MSRSLSASFWAHFCCSILLSQSYLFAFGIGCQNLSFFRMTDGPLIGSATSIGIVALAGTFVTYAQGHRWLCVFWSLFSLLAHGLPWLWESSSEGGERSASSATKSSIWEAYWFNFLTDEYPWLILDILFVNVPRRHQNVILANSLTSYPRQGQCAHYHTKHMLILNLDCREVVCTLCRQVYLFISF